MASTIRSNNAEGGSDGTTVTTGNSGGSSGNAFNSIVGTGLTFSNLIVGAGSLSYRTANASVYAVWNGLGAVTNWTLKARVYFANVSATQGVVYAKETSGDYTSLEYSGSTRYWRVRGTGGTTSGTVALSAATWYDVELSCANSNTNVAKIYNTSGTLLDTVSFANTVTVNLDEAWFGSFVATGVYPSYFDTFSVINDAAGGNESLTATSLSTGTPVMGSPAISQEHPFTANDLMSGTPVLGGPTLSEAHSLTASGLTTGTPVFTIPDLGSEHALTATGLTSGTPELGTPTFSYEFVATSLDAGVPTLGSPVIEQQVIFYPSGLTTGAPTLGTPVIFGDGVYSLPSAGGGVLRTIPFRRRRDQLARLRHKIIAEELLKKKKKS